MEVVFTNQKLFIKKKNSKSWRIEKNQHVLIGRNSRLDNIQAGMLRIKLKSLING